MPIFEFLCQDCGKEFEKLVFSQPEETLCRHCNSPRVDKLISRFSFKGSGEVSISSGNSSCGSCSAPSCSSCR